MPGYYDEGVGHGGFVAAFATAGNVVLESFNPDEPSAHIIQKGDEIGAPSKWAGVVGFQVASALAQLPVVAGVVVRVRVGDSFIAPNSHGGGTWVVTSVSAAFQVGDYWKVNLGLNLRYN